MKVFMLGWEFPPFISGGLGTACYGLTKAMDQLGLDVIFALPKPVNSEYATHVTMLDPNSCHNVGYDGDDGDGDHNDGGVLEYEEEIKKIKLCQIDSLLQPYLGTTEYQYRLKEVLEKKKGFINTPGLGGGEGFSGGGGGEMLSTSDTHYGGDMYSEVHRYAASAVRLALKQDFDVIHAHDWMTYPAGIAVAAVTGKPLVVHVHSTEFDRSGEHVNQAVYDIERKGMHLADRVIAVSHLTRNIIISRYGVCGSKVEVVYNAVERNGNGNGNIDKSGIASNEKIVLFLGRITMQKGPEYFLMAARKVLEVVDNVKFVMAGSGDMMGRVIEMAAEMGIGNKVLFTGFLRGDDVEKVYQMADLYVMPSVSEPFGIAPLEALNYDVPVLISKQSGCGNSDTCS